MLVKPYTHCIGTQQTTLAPHNVLFVSFMFLFEFLGVVCVCAKYGTHADFRPVDHFHPIKRYAPTISARQKTAEHTPSLLLHSLSRYGRCSVCVCLSGCGIYPLFSLARLMCARYSVVFYDEENRIPTIRGSTQRNTGVPETINFIEFKYTDALSPPAA